ncbi:hypothetical protein C8Q74DRAFT_500680 [Fomes fomentarius]|nr:hypothetical protein C8Q74DRAFT_500680 [Fomes fomentarius]
MARTSYELSRYDTRSDVLQQRYTTSKQRRRLVFAFCQRSSVTSWGIDRTCCYLLNAERTNQGKMSKYIHDLTEPGQKLSIKGPIPKFVYKTNRFAEVGMIAGGSGIAPMYQILEHALKDPSNKTRFTLIFANLSTKDIVLKDEFDALSRKYPSTFNVVYTVDKPEPDWKGPTGYVTGLELVQQHLPRPIWARRPRSSSAVPRDKSRPSRARRTG